jgi:hypothetical protein
VSFAFNDRQRDRLLAVGAAVFAASYIAAARGIEDSMLSDEVGAGGVPQGVGIAMLVAAIALFARTFIVAPKPAGKSDHEEGEEALPWAAVLLRTSGLVLILIVYGLLLPRLGYPVTVSLLVLASGLLAGAAPRWPLLVFAAASGPALWAMFDWALKVRMPVGSFWG